MRFDPDPTAPPGIAGLLLVANWVAWGVIFLACIALLVGLGRLAWAYRQGQLEEAMKGIVLPLVVIAGVGAIGGIVAAVTV